MEGAQRGDIVESVFIRRLDVEGMLIQRFFLFVFLFVFFFFFFFFFFVVVFVFCFLNVVCLPGNYRLRFKIYWGNNLYCHICA